MDNEERKEEQNLPPEGSSERRPDEGSDEEETRMTSLSGDDAGLTEEGSDWDDTAQEVRAQETDAEVGQGERGERGEDQEEDKGLLDKLKDKLKGEG